MSGLATTQQKELKRVKADMISTYLLATASEPSNGIRLSRVVCCAPKRLIFAVCVGMFAGMSPVVVAQANSLGITLNLPPQIASETVQINYFMQGQFGGYGGYVTREKDRVSYDIPASVDGKPAAAVKIIAYIPGCEIVKLEIAMQGVLEERTLPCRALGRVALRGRILPVSAAQTRGVEVEINYEADWDHGFFGIADGFVTSIKVATVILDEEGRFEIELPDFFNQVDLGKGSFQFLLRNKSGLIAMLKPESMPRFAGGLAIRSSYEPFVLFSADTSISTPSSAVSQPVEDRRYD